MLDSLMISSLLFLLIGMVHLLFLLKKGSSGFDTKIEELFPLCDYLICLAIVIIFICLACEYRIITFINQKNILSTSALFFPFALLINTLIGELWGYRTNLKFCFCISIAQLIFDCLLMGIVALPSPDFFNLNPFYSAIMLRRLPADSLTLLITFTSNTLLLHYLKRHTVQRPYRILIANTCANSLLCLVDYSLLYGGIYPYDQIINLVANVWHYKFIMILLLLPCALKICSSLSQNKNGHRYYILES